MTAAWYCTCGRIGHVTSRGTYLCPSCGREWPRTTHTTHTTTV